MARAHERVTRDRSPRGPTRCEVQEHRQGSGLAAPARVLIVDDEPAVLETYGAALRGEGHEVMVAGTGHDGLASARTERPDLVLLDSRLPDLHGHEVLRRLRADPATAAMAILLISAEGDLGAKVTGLGLGANDYLAKPVSLAELCARVGATLAYGTRLLARVDDALAARLRQSRSLAALDSRAPLENLVPALHATLGAELALRGLAVRLVGAGGLSAPLVAGAPPNGHLANDRPEGVPATPRIERAHGGELVHLPLETSASPYGLLSVEPRGEAERVLSTLVDLAPQIASLLAPGAAADRSRDEGREQIRQVMADGVAAPCFQPIVALGSGRVVGFEGLTRFVDGTRPDLRFRQAHRVGLGTELELHAARIVLDAARALPPGSWLSLNLSAATLLSAPLAWLAARSDRPLKLEITEHEHVTDYAELRDVVARLGDVELVVDDAGSGYASLRHVYELRPHVVKLDRGWTGGIDHDPLRQAMVSGVLQFAGVMGATVVAEGVERPEERDVCAALGVPLAQGFLFARPAPAETYADGAAVLPGWRGGTGPTDG